MDYKGPLRGSVGGVGNGRESIELQSIELHSLELHSSSEHQCSSSEHLNSSIKHHCSSSEHHSSSSDHHNSSSEHHNSSSEHHRSSSERQSNVSKCNASFLYRYPLPSCLTFTEYATLRKPHISIIEIYFIYSSCPLNNYPGQRRSTFICVLIEICLEVFMDFKVPLSSWVHQYK